MIKTRFLDLIGKYSDNQEYNLACWTEIHKNYSARSRYYHNLQHITSMIEELYKLESEIEDLDTLLFSIYYHDIIYKSTKSDNEYQSALLFEKRIAKTSFLHLEKCKTQIEATKEHKLSNDSDTNLLIDLDLSVLGKSPEEYIKYSENIRKEYNIYPDFMYKKGRKKVLEHFLNKDSIFKTEYFINRYEQQAINNLKTELLSL